LEVLLPARAKEPKSELNFYGCLVAAFLLSLLEALLCDRNLVYNILRRRRAGTTKLQLTSDQMIIEPGSGATTATILSTLAEATTPAAKVKVVVPEIAYGETAAPFSGAEVPPVSASRGNISHWANLPSRPRVAFASDDGVAGALDELCSSGKKLKSTIGVAEVSDTVRPARASGCQQSAIVRTAISDKSVDRRAITFRTMQLRRPTAPFPGRSPLNGPPDPP
jgi:hypothetical protein